jgi:hypothetical protein
VKLKRKINLIKWPKKKIKRMRMELIKSQEKNRNQNNEDQIGKHNTINLDWRMRMKTNKTFTKW